MDKLARQILDHLNQPGQSALALLEAYHTPDRVSKKLWETNPILYREFAARLIQQGHPAHALDLAGEREEYLKENQPDEPDPLRGDSLLRYHLALAAARGGNPLYAQRLLQPLLDLATDPDRLPHDLRKNLKLRVDVIAQMGRVLKDQSRRNRALIPESIRWYQQAADLPGAADLPDRATYPLINLATMWRLLPDADKAKQIAREVIKRLDSLLAPALKRGEHWLPATRAEAAVLVGDHEGAVEWYLKAIDIALARNAMGDVLAMLANLHRLAEVGATEHPTWIEKHIGSVVVFSGHMIDSPDRQAKREPPRFPNVPLLAEKVKQMIAARLDDLRATVGYCSLACGSDILFAEAMQERSAELHVVLPFAQKDFVRKSVDFGLKKPMERWLNRFHGVLGKLPEDNLHYATTEPYLGAKELFDFVNTFAQGLAVIQARYRLVKPRALVVIDDGSKPKSGGTHHFYKTWAKVWGKPEAIPLPTVRDGLPPLPPTEVHPEPAEPPTAKWPRPIKAMLFADVAGFSAIPEASAPRFLSQYFAFLKGMFRGPLAKTVVFANTWGDGLHAVFNHVTDAAEFALTLLDRAALGKVKWIGAGPGEVPLRIALHVGPVFEYRDLIQGRSAYSGQHVNRAARIEPVTLPGCVYASEQFAALLTMHDSKRRYACEFVGIRSLPKGFGRCPLYHIIRA